MNFLHKTKGGAPINGKQLIFVHATESDHNDRDKVIDMILESENGGDYAVLYNDDKAFPVDFKTPELSRINLYVPVITENYLKQCGRDMDYLKLSAGYGFSVLPVVQSSDLIPAFNERFKNIHAITLTMKDPKLEIEKLLSRMLVSAELIEEIIRDGFTRRLFLSYRKKDKAEVERIMRAVHNTKWGKAAAIWFDDFLVPGTDFESGINEAMIKADAVVFAVTNNLPKLNDEGKKNYVCEHEYPDAVKLGKKCLAVEAEPTSRQELDDALGKDFPQSIPVDDRGRMDDAFDKLGGEESDPDPYVMYLRAMAYMLGVRVEKDTNKALDMLDKCADKGVVEAAMQLADMYAFERFVPMDGKTASKYKRRAYDIVRGRKTSYEKLSLLNEILLGHGGEGVDVSFNVEERDSFCKAYIEEIDKFLQSGNGKHTNDLLLWQAEAYVHIGNIEDHPNGTYDELHGYLLKAYRIMDRIHNENAEYHRVYAMLRSIDASLARSNDEPTDFGVYESLQAVRHQQRAVDLEPTWGARWRLASYRGNAMGCKYLDALHKDRHALLPLKDVKQNVEDYEKLYKEKKDPQLAAELITAYKNMPLTTNDKDKKREYIENAYDRVHHIRVHYTYVNGERKLCYEYYNYPPLYNLENELEAEMRKYKKHKIGKLSFSLPNDDTLSAARLPLVIIQCLLSGVIGFFAGYAADILPLLIAVAIIPLPFIVGRLKPGWRILIDVIILIAAIVGVFVIPGFVSWSLGFKLLYLIGVFIVATFLV